MEKSKRSARAKEAHAELLLKISGSLTTAFFVTVLILPMTLFIQSVFNPAASGWHTSIKLTSPSFLASLILFLLCEAGVYKIGSSCKDRAMYILDELEREKVNEGNNG